MRNGNYTAKRRINAQEWRGSSVNNFSSVDNFGVFSGFSRNRNAVRMSGSGKLGSFALIGIFFVMLMNLGLIYVGQSAKATSLDYERSEISSQIDKLEAKKEDLAVEKARLTSIATSNNSKVAMAMENAEVSGHAE